MANKGAVEQLGEEAQHLAIKYQVEGLTAANIASKLNEQFDANLSEGEIRNFSERARHEIFSVAKENKDFGQRITKNAFDAVEQLKTLNTHMWEFFLGIKDDPEFSSKQIFCPECNHKFRVQVRSFNTLVRAADHLLKQIDSQNKTLKNFGNFKFEYNIVNLTQNLNQFIPQIFHAAERNGDIRILKKKKYKL